MPPMPLFTLLLVVSVFACGVLGTAAAPAAVDLAALARCEASVGLAHPDATFEEFVALSLANCGQAGTTLVTDVLHAILASREPAVARHAAAAKDALLHEDTLRALRAHVGRP